ncbi:hypothetical protein [Botrimarina sp.]|uniref:hypothetical protein n=1 Tax=Botrimarina sp. TaxID=2795802 RepID=UPI0032EBBD24
MKACATLLAAAALGGVACAAEFGGLRLTPVGGYRVPVYSSFHRPHEAGASRSTGYTNGSIAVHTFEDGRTVFWHENGKIGKQFLESHTVAEMGSMDGDPAKWPLLTEASSPDRVWTQHELYGDRGPRGYHSPGGILFDPAVERLWFGTDIWYHTKSDPEQWLAVVDYNSGEVLPVTPSVPLPMHKFSGGFGLIPEGFATEHLDGKRFAFIAGGYSSGQGAAIGPTLAAMSLEPQENPEAVVLLDHLATAEVGGVPFSEGKRYVPEAFADYTTDMNWYYPVHEGVGYWTGTIKGNGCWLKIDGFEGVLYLAAYGAGEQKYRAQTEGWGAPVKNVLYIYDAEAFVDVARLKRWPLGCPREYYEFYRFDEAEKGINRIGRSITIDQGTGLLWVCYPQVWKPNQSATERFPVVIAYRASAVSAAERESEDKPARPDVSPGVTE